MKESNIRHTLATRLQSLPAEQIKQAVLKWLDTEGGDLVDLEQNLAPEREVAYQPALSATQKATAFKEWADSHRRGLPLLSDEAISRESIYSNERL